MLGKSALHVVFVAFLIVLPLASLAAQDANQPSITIGLSALKPSAPKTAQSPDQSVRSSIITISGSRQWSETNIDVEEGSKLVFSCSGNVRCLGSPESGPDGAPRGWKDLLRILPVSDGGRCALIGRIGTGDLASFFLIGSKKEIRAPHAGKLYLGINLSSNETAEGGFTVQVQQIRSSTDATNRKAMSSAKSAGLIAKITPDILKQIPARVTDPDGRPGDMVNFLIIGAEDRMHLAFESAGWVKVDRTSKDAVTHSILSSLSKQSYVEMPMSILTLFDRPQDYGFAHAIPFSVIMTRHHLRVWKAPWQVNGQTVWVGAGTHDIGIERDQRNGGVTHKIDPAVDGERDFIGESLASSGILSARTYVTPLEPVTEAKTATGGTFHSDGRLLVMELSGTSSDASSNFADTFCRVLQDENPDNGTWEGCNRYIDGDRTSSAALEPLFSKYRVLILPGFLSSCVSSTPALAKGQEHLRSAHSMTVEFLPLPNESSADNGKLITDYLKSHFGSDQRKYIVIGYSKGAPDFQEGLAASPDTVRAVAAFVSLAGAVGGSPVADLMPSIIERYAKGMNLGACQGDVSQAFKSLRQDVRHEFQANNPDPLVPTYSLTAVSDQQTTSKMLLQAWHLLSAYDVAEDSQLTRQDAIVPGSTVLGTLHADHLAVALGFTDSANTQVKSMMDHNVFPRAALLESIVRFVTADLDKNR